MVGRCRPAFSERRPKPVLLPGSFCVPLRHRLSDLSRFHRPINRRAIDRKFNGFKCVQIIRHRFFGSTCHHFRLILECPTSECTQNHHFVTVQSSYIQNPGQPLLMDFQKFPVADFYRPITVSRLNRLLGRSRRFGAAQVITSTSYQSFSSINFGVFVSVLNTVTSGV